jgi:hypothetical protein
MKVAGERPGLASKIPRPSCESIGGGARKRFQYPLPSTHLATTTSIGATGRRSHVVCLTSFHSFSFSLRKALSARCRPQLAIRHQSDNHRKQPKQCPPSHPPESWVAISEQSASVSSWWYESQPCTPDTSDRTGTRYSFDTAKRLS